MGACVSCDGRRASLDAVAALAGGAASTFRRVASLNALNASNVDAWIVPTFPLARRYDVEAMYLTVPELGPKRAPCVAVFALDPLDSPSSSPTIIRRLGLVQRIRLRAQSRFHPPPTTPLTVINASGRVIGWDPDAAEGSVDALAIYLSDAAATELGPDIERVDVYVRTNLDVEYRCRGVLGLRRALRGALPTVLCARTPSLLSENA